MYFPRGLLADFIITTSLVHVLMVALMNEFRSMSQFLLRFGRSLRLENDIGFISFGSRLSCSLRLEKDLALSTFAFALRNLRYVLTWLGRLRSSTHIAAMPYYPAGCDDWQSWTLSFGSLDVKCSDVSPFYVAR